MKKTNKKKKGRTYNAKSKSNNDNIKVESCNKEITTII